MSPRLSSLFLALLLAPLPAHAQDVNNGGGACVESGTQVASRIAPDGQGGVFVTWQDTRRGEYDIYAQHLDSKGGPLWPYNGIAISKAPSTQQTPSIIPDGQGGAIIAWEDYRSGQADVYAQRVSSTGAYLWTFNGVAVSAAVGYQTIPALTTDGSGGCIVTWQDARAGNIDIYVQRITGAGTPYWTLDGVGICVQGASQSLPTIVSDNAAGAIILWQDPRSTQDIYAQRVNSGGIVQWTANGLPVCAAILDQTFPVAISDGAGGVIAAWQDQRAGASIHAQRLNSLGVALWATDGVALCSATSATAPAIAQDGANGAIVTWQDQRSGIDVYAQRVGAAGVPLWTGNGVIVCNVINSQYSPVITEDGAGGGVISWHDLRSGGTYDIFAQRIDGSGVRQWTPDGVQFTDLPSSSQWFPAIAPDAGGGAFVSWQDDRYTTASDVFIQHVGASGVLLVPDAESPRIASVRDVPNDQGGRVKVSWAASNQDLSPFFRVTEYWVWRSAPNSAVTSARQLGMLRSLLDLGGGEVPVGTVATTTQNQTTYYWEYVTSQPTGHLLNYSYVAATTSDSLPGSNPYTAFMIQARTSGGAQWWYSIPDSGYSVDNLAPQSPASASATHVKGTTILHWQPNSEPDLGTYRVYRGLSPDFEPSTASLVATSSDTVYFDPAVADLYYKLSAVDLHGNESRFTLIRPTNTTGVVADFPAARVWLGNAAPNPLRSEASIGFGLAYAAHVTLAVFDPSGRRVRTIFEGFLDPGKHSAQWDGRDDQSRSVANGLYFYRLDVEGKLLSGRMVKAD